MKKTVVTSWFKYGRILLGAHKHLSPANLQTSEKSKGINTPTEICHANYPRLLKLWQIILCSCRTPCVERTRFQSFWRKKKQQRFFFTPVSLNSGIVTEDLVRPFLSEKQHRSLLPASPPLLPPSLPSLITPNATRPHHRKIHSHRSLRPAAVATIILEEETLAINYMCAFHLLFCGGEPLEDLGGDGEVGQQESDMLSTPEDLKQHGSPPPSPNPQHSPALTSVIPDSQWPLPFISTRITLDPDLKLYPNVILTVKPWLSASTWSLTLTWAGG